jgi:hypothetical protein
MAHDVLECVGKFCYDCIPYEFVSFVPSLADVFADSLDLVIDPVSNFRSSCEGEKQHSTFQWSGHDPGLIIKDPVDVPFCEEVFDFGSMSIIDFGFPS